MVALVVLGEEATTMWEHKTMLKVKETLFMSA